MLAPGRRSPSEVRSVLIYSTEERTGDGLIKLPFLAGVRRAFPAARLTWCAAAGQSVYGGWLAPVVAPLIDELLLTGPVGATVGELLPWARPFAGRRFDLVIDTQLNVRRTLALRPAARRLISAAAGFRFSAVRAPHWPAAMAAQLQVLLSLATEETLDPASVALVDDELLAAARHLLPPGPVYVGLAPGAGGAERRWPLARYLALATQLEANNRVPVFIIGPQELDYLPRIAEVCPGALLPLQAPHGLSADKAPRLTIALAHHLSAAVASDAGPGHLLAAGGVPLVSLAITRRKAEKFRPATARVLALVAEDVGGTTIDDIALRPVADALQAQLGIP